MACGRSGLRCVDLKGGNHDAVEALAGCRELRSRRVAGVFLIASPWLLGFDDRQAVMRNAVITGIAVVALAAWTLLTDKDHGTWRGKSAAH